MDGIREKYSVLKQSRTDANDKVTACITASHFNPD